MGDAAVHEAEDRFNRLAIFGILSEDAEHSVKVAPHIDERAVLLPEFAGKRDTEAAQR